MGQSLPRGAAPASGLLPALPGKSAEHLSPCHCYSCSLLPCASACFYSSSSEPGVSVQITSCSLLAFKWFLLYVTAEKRLKASPIPFQKHKVNEVMAAVILNPVFAPVPATWFAISSGLPRSSSEGSQAQLGVVPALAAGTASLRHSQP